MRLGKNDLFMLTPLLHQNSSQHTPGECRMQRSIEDKQTRRRYAQNRRAQRREMCPLEGAKEEMLLFCKNLGFGERFKFSTVAVESLNYCDCCLVKRYLNTNE